MGWVRSGAPLLIAALLMGCATTDASRIIVPAEASSPAEQMAAPPATSEADATAAHLLDLFGQPCLMRFPDDGAMDRFAQAQNLTPMSEDEVRRLLGADPGIGWLGSSSLGAYELTLEKPPFHACAIRVRFNELPNFRLSLILGLSMWAAQSGATLKELPPESTMVDGQPTDASPYLLVDPDHKARQDFLVIVSHFPSGASEVRLVRQIMPQPIDLR